MTKEINPVVSSTSQEPIRSALFTNLLNSSDNFPCQCENSSFEDPQHWHNLTGDLKIARDNKLQGDK